MIEDASITGQASSTPHTQSAPEIVHQSSPVSAGTEPVADESKSQPEHMQGESAASEAKPTDETGKVELEKKTLQVPETETEQGPSEQGPSGSTEEPLKETSRLIVLERVPNLLVSENELAPANIPKASDLSNTVEHHVDNPGSQTQECHVGSSPAVSGTPEEGESTPTASAPATADGIHPEVPVSSTTPQESSSLVVINDPALVIPTPLLDYGPSTSSTSPPTETIEALASNVLPHSTSPGPSVRDSSETSGPAANQDIDATGLLSSSANLQSSSPDENTLSGEKSTSQDVTDRRQLPHILTLPFSFTVDVSLALSLIPASNFSTSIAEDWAKACNNDDVRPVKEGKHV